MKVTHGNDGHDGALLDGRGALESTRGSFVSLAGSRVPRNRKGTHP